ncbi:TetR/AcrR family transcriptional regulator [Paenibacillus sp. YPG26]|uniref:TetR/AcrR family transcriptional regulator n=1 Tax=Paenibacillus sp. YPG26 TaxID=2878915 RepID=UPI002041B527|nr:TetR/AcrR family transcriptional regulator [Paenibacillus sp. YPG26]USB33142.1 TetR/AcrR family transcriptional regulator [Paenibacillus sp. YPG26]
MNTNTVDQILDTAQLLVQSVGFNAFSYADISKEIGIRKASIHYHFPNKADLGEALVVRYHRGFVDALAQIDAGTQDDLERLRQFTLLYKAGPSQDFRLCLGVMYGADYVTLPEEVQGELTGYFATNLTWLEQVMDRGLQAGTLTFKGTAQAEAHKFLAALQGAQLLARSFKEIGKYDVIAEELITALVP